MQLASELLTGTQASIAEVAQRLGYGSEAALSRAFKRIVGSSPAHWRQGKRTAAA
ncbi:MAG: helix-turn-helix domain-containing protein [Myxococcaceae bacterium]